MSAFVVCSTHLFAEVTQVCQGVKTRVKEFQNFSEDFTGLSRSQRLLPKNSKFLSRGIIIVEVTRFVEELKILVKEIKDSCQG